MNLTNYIFKCTECNYQFECCTLPSCAKEMTCRKCLSKAEIVKTRKAIVLYKCTSELCGKTIKAERGSINKCDKCSSAIKIQEKKKPYIFIPRKHQSASSDKSYDSHPLDDGIPFGEVPGDEVHTKGKIDDPITPKP